MAIVYLFRRVSKDSASLSTIMVDTGGSGIQLIQLTRP